MSELFLSSASSWATGAAGRIRDASSSARFSVPKDAATALEIPLLLGPSPVLRGTAPVHYMGGGPRTYPGGVTKWQWKRMQLKKSRQIEKARLQREKHLYEARRRAELQATSPVLEMPWQKLSRVRPPNYVTADEQVTKLAARFQRRGGEDLWTEADGPEKFEALESHLSAQLPDANALSEKAPASNVQNLASSNVWWNRVQDTGSATQFTSFRHRPPMRSPSHLDASDQWMSSRPQPEEEMNEVQSTRQSSYSQYRPRIRPNMTKGREQFQRTDSRDSRSQHSHI